MSEEETENRDHDDDTNMVTTFDDPDWATSEGIGAFLKFNLFFILAIALVLNSYESTEWLATVLCWMWLPSNLFWQCFFSKEDNGYPCFEPNFSTKIGATLFSASPLIFVCMEAKRILIGEILLAIGIILIEIVLYLAYRSIKSTG